MRRTSFQSFTDGRQRSTSQPKARNSLAAFAVAESPAESASKARAIRRKARAGGSQLGKVVPHKATDCIPAAARLRASIGASTITTKEPASASCEVWKTPADRSPRVSTFGPYSADAMTRPG